MKTFMSTMINEGKNLTDPELQQTDKTAPIPFNQSTECSSCNNTNVVATAGESGDTVIQNGEGTKLNQLQGDNTQIAQAQDNTGTTTVVQKGPMGVVLTQALNQAYKRNPVPAYVSVGNESIFKDVETKISANGQAMDISNKNNEMTRASLLVGMLPAPTAEVNCLNVALQAMGAVKKVDYVFVNVSDLGVDGASTPGNTSRVMTVPYNQNLQPGDIPDNVAVESVEMVIRYKLTK